MDTSPTSPGARPDEYVSVPRADLDMLIHFSGGLCQQPPALEVARQRLMAATQQADNRAETTRAWQRLCDLQHHRGVECPTAVCRWNLP